MGVALDLIVYPCVHQVAAAVADVRARGRRVHHPLRPGEDPRAGPPAVRDARRRGDRRRGRLAADRPLLGQLDDRELDEDRRSCRSSRSPGSRTAASSAQTGWSVAPEYQPLPIVARRAGSEGPARASLSALGRGPERGPAAHRRCDPGVAPPTSQGCRAASSLSPSADEQDAPVGPVVRPSAVEDEVPPSSRSQSPPARRSLGVVGERAERRSRPTASLERAPEAPPVRPDHEKSGPCRRARPGSNASILGTNRGTIGHPRRAREERSLARGAGRRCGSRRACSPARLRLPDVTNDEVVLPGGSQTLADCASCSASASPSGDERSPCCSSTAARAVSTGRPRTHRGRRPAGGGGSARGRADPAVRAGLAARARRARRRGRRHGRAARAGRRDPHDAVDRGAPRARDDLAAGPRALRHRLPCAPVRLQLGDQGGGREAPARHRRARAPAPARRLPLARARLAAARRRRRSRTRSRPGCIYLLAQARGCPSTARRRRSCSC